ncbi:MAG: HNH endonuclease [Bacilli bacterium]|nr:HNH endonuclease [Bacilli bacterium]
MDEKKIICLEVTSFAKQGEYVYALIHGHPNATSKSYVLYHRLVMENYLGRYLTKDEVVHHKDGNKTNNDITNLELMTNSEHTRLHAKEMGKAKAHMMLELMCPICGKIFYRRVHDSQFNCTTKSYNKSNANCCSFECGRKMSDYIRYNKIPIEVQERIPDNIQDVFYEFNDPSLNDY